MSIKTIEVVMPGIKSAFVFLEKLIKAGCRDEIRVYMSLFERESKLYSFHNQTTARLAIKTFRACADEIEKALFLLPEEEHVASKKKRKSKKKKKQKQNSHQSRA